ncbi:MAG: tRNA (N6-isopentenyl adenosine(37)-C2)-methylthiotransferase MiaB [Anaerolineae bacterium]|nr:tRNA (N6-isopentenyl adenosine(37)-C2)-methylthiotransferase MiaB [Anaerolineae bacterium]
MSKKYHFWMTGCQMNYADARQVATALEKQGFRATSRSDDADVVILQTCTVRQQSEDKAYNKLRALWGQKKQNPDLTIAVMGCVVGVRGNAALEQEFPYVDVFMEPATDGAPLLAHLLQGDDQAIEAQETAWRHAVQDAFEPQDVILPVHEAGSITAPVAIVYGCSHACTFCIIPQKRGIERSRPIGAIVAEVRSLVAQGVKEVTLLGQIVDRYGYDVADGPDLADLLRQVNDVAGLERVRFLTSHPNYMSDRILEAVRDLPKVMPHIEIPVQAGDDDVLRNMKRGYTQAEFIRLTERIRAIVPDAAINGDVIVGFPGETDAQFEETVAVLQAVRHSKVHLARYSPRPGTVSERRMDDDVPDAVKRARFQCLEALQRQIQLEDNQAFIGRNTSVLVEERYKGRWRGRNPQNKLVFFDDDRDLKGTVVDVKIVHAGPYSMSGVLAQLMADTATEPVSIPLAVL